MNRQYLQGKVSAAALLPLRLFLGFTFVYAGLDKLLDPAFLDPASPGGIKAQLEAFTHFSPLAPFIQAVALPFPVAIGILMALGEIAVGLGALTGILYRLAAAGGAFISLTLFLTASWAIRPYYLGNDLPYLLGWITLAAVGSGGVLVLGPWLELKVGLRRVDPSAEGGGPDVETVASAERRLFLGAALLGGATLVLAAAAAGLRALVPGSATSGGIGTPAPPSQPAGGPAGSAAPSTGSAAPVGSAAPAGSTSPTPASPAAGNAIANTADFAQTAEVAFTVPSSGDPGALIKLKDGTFVAYDAVCTHQGCTVSEYDSATQHLICPCHGSTFDAANNASVVSGPARSPLAKVPLNIDSATGSITVAS